MGENSRRAGVAQEVGGGGIVGSVDVLLATAVATH